MVLGFDPVRSLQELLTVILISILLVVAYVFRKKILLFVSGDDHLHITFNDLIFWFCCHCCGSCNGEWTRCCTRCPCCPRRIRGKNLVNELGRHLGLTTSSIEMKNLVVGDLPVKTGSRQDFYLMIECAANPELVTSLAEGKLPKVVHFPEVITLRLRGSALEGRVRVVVKALRVVGSEELCHCYFGTDDVMHWAKSSNEKMMRFEMRNIDPSFLSETPAWIALQFSHPTEARDLENFTGGATDTVRTASPDGHCQDFSVSEFKKNYQLLDQAGGCVQEPSEQDLIRIHRFRRNCDCGYCLCNCCTQCTVVGFLGFRFYAWSCFHHYKLLTMAWLKATRFPVPLEKLQAIDRNCTKTFKGTGIAKGQTSCRPTDQQVQNFARVVLPALQNGTHKNYGRLDAPQPTPQAFKYFIYKLTDLTLPGVTCMPGIVSWRNSIVEMDSALFIGCFIMLIFMCCCKMYVNSTVRAMRDRITAKRAETNQMTNLLADERVLRTLRAGGHLR